MEKITTIIDNVYIMVMCSFKRLKESERGDTNFISMLLIIAIVVVLAGAFYTMGDKAMQLISNKVENFITNPGSK